MYRVSDLFAGVNLWPFRTEIGWPEVVNHQRSYPLTLQPLDSPEDVRSESMEPLWHGTC